MEQSLTFFVEMVVEAVRKHTMAVPYRPEVARALDGEMGAAILLQHFFFQFGERNYAPFPVNLYPPSKPDQRDNSISTTLGYNRRTLERALNQIGTRVKRGQSKDDLYKEVTPIFENGVLQNPQYMVIWWRNNKNQTIIDLNILFILNVYIIIFRDMLESKFNLSAYLSSRGMGGVIIDENGLLAHPAFVQNEQTIAFVQNEQTIEIGGFEQTINSLSDSSKPYLLREGKEDKDSCVDPDAAAVKNKKTSRTPKKETVPAAELLPWEQEITRVLGLDAALAREYSNLRKVAKGFHAARTSDGRRMNVSVVAACHRYCIQKNYTQITPNALLNVLVYVNRDEHPAGIEEVKEYTIAGGYHHEEVLPVTFTRPAIKLPSMYRSPNSESSQDS